MAASDSDSGVKVKVERLVGTWIKAVASVRAASSSFMRGATATARASFWAALVEGEVAIVWSEGILVGVILNRGDRPGVCDGGEARRNVKKVDGGGEWKRRRGLMGRDEGGGWQEMKRGRTD